MRKTLFFILVSIVFSCKTQAQKTTNSSNIEEFKKLTNIETKNWIKKNVDSVLAKHSFNATNKMKMPYRLFSPKETSTKKPLVIFLHGRGERGSDNSPKLYNSTGLFMSENSLLAPNMQSKYPCYVLIPQCSNKTENEEWAKWVGNSPKTPFKGLGLDGSYTMNPTPSESGTAALELIDHIIKTENIDPNRVYIIGLSMGGFGTWEFTARRPELFAAAVPMAGYSDAGQIEKIKKIPYWIFHGNIDEWNPVEGSRNMFKLLTEARADVKYTEYDNANHGTSFIKAFNEPELIPWMFSKTK